jgi:pimeloyl-ACP methyl ester carboxylesterase
MKRVIFLPGAGGDPAFWKPVADRLEPSVSAVRLSWPGAGRQPADPAVQSFDDLVRYVRQAMPEPGVLVAQSLGGVAAIRLAAQHPESMRGLVLTATSGGVGVGTGDWQSVYRRTYPSACTWVTDAVPDQTTLVRQIAVPTLLIWGDSDPISPVAVGERLHGLIAASDLQVVRGGDHDLALEHSEAVADVIGRFLVALDLP